MYSERSLKYVALGLLFGFTFHFSPASAGQTGGLRYTVFVEKFDNNSEAPASLGHEWATQLTTALQESGQFIVVAQSDMQKSALDEQARGASGVTVQGKKTAAHSRMSLAQLLVKGVITHFQKEASNQGGGFEIGQFKIGGGRAKTEIRATLQMIDSTTGALVAAKNFVGSAQGRGIEIGLSNGNGMGSLKAGQKDNVHAALEKAINEVIPWMVEQLPSVPWRGSVVKVDGEKIILNRGSREGVSVGDVFVVGESEIISDPDTGETLDEVVHERARVKVTNVTERTSFCAVTEGNGDQVVQGMGVQPEKERS